MAPSTWARFCGPSASAMSGSWTRWPRCVGPGVGAGGRAGRGGGDHRLGLHYLRGVRQDQAGRRLRLHQLLGYHPLVATRADTGEVLHIRMRKGSAHPAAASASSKPSAGSAGPGLPGRWCCGPTRASGRMTIDPLDATTWATPSPCADPRDQRRLGHRRRLLGRHRLPRRTSPRSPRASTGRRLIVRRSRIVGPKPPSGRIGATSASSPTGRDHHRTRRLPPPPRPVELAIKELKEEALATPVRQLLRQRRLARLCRPSPQPHPLVARLGELTPEDQLVVARTVRTRFFSVPGRLVSRSGTHTLRAPLHWPWAEVFDRALEPSPCSATSAALTPTPRPAHRRRPRRTALTNRRESQTSGLARLQGR